MISKAAVHDAVSTSFMQLLIAYTICAFVSSISAFSTFTIHFEVLALILATFAVVSIQEKTQTRVSTYWLIPAFLFVALIRILPYLHNAVPLGYDPGLYHYLIDHPFARDYWVSEGWEPGLFLVTSVLKALGLSTDFILTYGLILFELLLGSAIYVTAKKYFNASVGVLAVLLYAVSATQFIAFAYNYFKQILGLTLLLWAFCLMHDKKPTKTTTALLVVTASFLGAVHRPTFLIFGLVFFAQTLYNSRTKIDFRNILTGCAILLATLLAYVGRISIIILPWIVPLSTANVISGTFIDLARYQLLCLAYLPFALIGFFFLAKKKAFNALWIYFLINGIIVLFKLFFYNRYIISLDIAMIILAAYGLSLLLQRKRLGTAIAVILILSSGYVVFADASHAQPLIDQNEFDIIQSPNIEPDAFFMSTDSAYSPWLLYSERRVIAPGLFDDNKWSRQEWEQFWHNQNVTALMSRYDKPVYVFVGRKRPLPSGIFENDCFTPHLNQSGTRIYKWHCAE